MSAHFSLRRAAFCVLLAGVVMMMPAISVFGADSRAVKAANTDTDLRVLMKLPDRQGTSTVTGYEDWIEIESFIFEVDNEGEPGEAALIKNLQIIKHPGPESVYAVFDAYYKRMFEKVVIHVIRLSGQAVFLQESFEAGPVLITKVQRVLSTEGEDEAWAVSMEDISTLSLTSYQYDPAGKPIGDQEIEINP